LGAKSASNDEELPWLARKIPGPMNHDVDTDDEAWRFFRTRTRRRGAYASGRLDSRALIPG